MKRGWVTRGEVWGILAVVLGGCAAATPPLVIHETPRSAVWVKFDPEAGTGHTHPAMLTPTQIATILRGVWVTKRDPFGLGGLFQGHPDTVPAFTPADLTFLAPHLSEALRKASPKDLVTFYLVMPDPNLGKLVTSGGLFVRNQYLYVILANFRTPPSSGPYEGIAYELDNREEPLLPIARHTFSVGFSPKEAWIPNGEAGGRTSYLRSVDPAKQVVIDLERLPAVIHGSLEPAKPSSSPSRP